MNWSASLIDATLTLGKFALIIVVYFFSKYYIQRSRQDSTEAAKVVEKIFVYAAAVLLIGFAAWFVTGFNSFNLSLFVILLLPCLYGLFSEFSKDAKLTPAERKQKSMDMNTDNFKSRKYDNEF